MKRVTVFSTIMRWDDMVMSSINSVLNQTYKNFIYYINVSDVTYEKLKDLQSEDDRIRLIKVKIGDEFGFRINSHKIAEGSEYICTLDGDDKFEPDFLETQINFIESYDLDISCCGINYVDLNGKVFGNKQSFEHDVFFEREKFVKLFHHYFIYMRAIWGKVFRTSLLKEGIWDNFPKPDFYGGYSGDTKTSLELVKNAKNIGIHSRIGYQYTMWEDSASYNYYPGRENSAEFLYEMLIDFHSHFTDKIPPSNYHFIYLAYLSCIQDTLELFTNIEMEAEEKIAKFDFLFGNENIESIIAVVKNSDIPDQGVILNIKTRLYKFILQNCFNGKTPSKTTLKIFKCFFSSYNQIANNYLELIFNDVKLFNLAVLHEDDFVKLANELIAMIENSYNIKYLQFFSIIANNELINYIISSSPNDDFLKSNIKLISCIFNDKFENAVNYIVEKLVSNDANSIFLTDILSYIAARLEDEDLYIRSKVIKIDMLKSYNMASEAEKVINELKEIGVQLDE